MVSLAVRDQEKALERYQEKLGFVVRADAPFEMNGKTGRWLTVSPPGNEEVEIALLELDEDLYDGEMLERVEKMRGTDPLWTFTTAEMDAAIADLKERGVDIDDELRDTPWGRFGIFRDLDGNSLQLYQSVEMGEWAVQLDAVRPVRPRFSKTSSPADSRHR